MFEGADENIGVITELKEIEASVDPNGTHVSDLEAMADEAGVPNDSVVVELDQSNEKHCTWEAELEKHDKKEGT